MTIGVGGSTAEKELAAMKSMRGDVPPIGVDERLRRVARAQAIMRDKGIDALYLDVSSSMVYFTGLNFRRTERMHSAVLPAKGDIVYVSPAFEVEKLKTMTSSGDKIEVWEEDEDPSAVVTETVRTLGYSKGVIAVDEATPFFTFDGLRRAGNSYNVVNAVEITAACRMLNSEQAPARGLESGEGGTGGCVCSGETGQQVRRHRRCRTRRHHRGRVWPRLCDAGITASDRPRHRPRCPRVALSREGRQDRVAAGH